MKDTTFYNKESTAYSEKRYPKVTETYTQFFFKERLNIVLSMLKNIVGNNSNHSLLEIGCADGIVLRAIHDTFHSQIKSCVGIDISPGMIDSAKRKNADTPIIFNLREEYTDTTPVDLVVEVGVINYARFEEELAFIKAHLAQNGYTIISLAGTNSLWNKVKPGDKGYNNFLSYKQYEKSIRELFEVVEVASVGFYMPLIWKVPFVARMIQPLESLVRYIAPNAFHEKIYVLKHK